MILRVELKTWKRELTRGKFPLEVTYEREPWAPNVTVFF